MARLQFQPEEVKRAHSAILGFPRPKTNVKVRARETQSLRQPKQRENMVHHTDETKSNGEFPELDLYSYKSKSSNAANQFKLRKHVSHTLSRSADFSNKYEIENGGKTLSVKDIISRFIHVH